MGSHAVKINQSILVLSYSVSELTKFIRNSSTKHIQISLQSIDIWLKLSFYSIKRKAVNDHYIMLFIISIWCDLTEFKISVLWCIVKKCSDRNTGFMVYSKTLLLLWHYGKCHSVPVFYLHVFKKLRGLWKLWLIVRSWGGIPVEESE